MIFIGIDLGTSAVKLIAMKEKRQNSQNRFKGISPVFSEIRLVRAKSRGLVLGRNVGTL